MRDYQIKAIEKATQNAIKKFEVPYKPGNTPLKTVISPEFKAYVADEVLDVVLSNKAIKTNDKYKINLYVDSLINSAWNNNIRFNGKAK